MLSNIKNNSYINLCDKIHIRIVRSCSSAVKKHNASYTSLKNLATGLLVAKILIKNNSNSPEKNDDEEKEPIKFTEQKAGPEIMKIYWL